MRPVADRPLLVGGSPVLFVDVLSLRADDRSAGPVAAKGMPLGSMFPGSSSMALIG
ncbi:hypothetical protein [Fibrella arboris]|uniref:hypothetical protein n=1 Tax=Fibrella arboris TaxID=3242486 RepID=UPI0035220BCE